MTSIDRNLAMRFERLTRAAPSMVSTPKDWPKDSGGQTETTLNHDLRPSIFEIRGPTTNPSQR
jgi:hypothetical protein